MRTVRILAKEDIDAVLDYFFNATPEFLRAMGADSKKLPTRSQFYAKIANELPLAIHQKTLFYVVWVLDNVPVGHSNINNITFKEEAYMHLHLWQDSERRQGNGSYFIIESLRHYFEIFQLKKIYCEPYADNPAPNKTLLRTGFRFVKQYETIPGTINFHQSVNRWELTKETFKTIYS